MILWPNAKLNIGLNVLRKRPDGYHDLETLFVPYFGFKDRLCIEESDELKVDISPCDWDPSKDLTVRAWQLLQRDFGIPAVSISLQKGIPVGAGLGGGSADAAFMLRGLNEMFSLGLGKEDLAAYAARLGSDCAFFIYNEPMFGSGTGSELEPYDLSLDGLDVRVALPYGVSVSTALAYKGVQMHSGEDLAQTLKRPLGEWKEYLKNSFEPSVFAAFPQIRELKEEFYRQGAVYSAMSGSGSAVFAIFTRK